jgi:hypothetical protein
VAAAQGRKDEKTEDRNLKLENRIKFPFSIFEFRLRGTGPWLMANAASVLDEGFEFFLGKLVTHLVGFVACAKWTDLHAVEVIVRVSMFRRHHERTISTRLENIQEGLSILLRAQGRYLKNYPLPDSARRRRVGGI